MSSKKEKWGEIGILQIHLDKAGDEIVGKLLEVEETVLDVNLYHIERIGDMKEVVLLGSSGLDKKLESVVVGQTVWILLQGIIPTRQGYNFKDYRVFIKPAE